MRLTGVQQIPGSDYGVGTWEDGSKTRARLSVLNDAYQGSQKPQDDQRLAWKAEYDPDTGLPIPPQARTDVPTGPGSSAYRPVSNESPKPPQAPPAARQASLVPVAADIVNRAMQPRTVVTPAFNPQEYDASQSAVRQGVVTERTAGPAVDEQQWQQVHDLERRAAITQGAADVAEAEGRLAGSRTIANQQMSDLRQSQAHQAEVERQYQEDLAQTQAEGRAIGERKIDYGRAFSSNNVLQNLALAVAAGLQAMGGRGQSSIMDMIQSRMAQDANIQARSIAQDKDRNETALGRLAQRWGSIEAARAALHVQQTEAVKAMVQAQADRAGTQRAQIAAVGMIQALDAKQQRELVVMRQAAEGQVTERESAKFMAPRAASVQVVTPSADKQLALVERLVKLGISEQDANKVILENQKLGLENQKTQQELAGGGPQKPISPTIAEKQGDARQASEKALAIMQKWGIRYDQQTGSYVATRDIPGAGLLAGRAPAMSGEAQAFRSDMSDLAELTMIAQGGRRSAEAKNNVLSDLLGDGREDTIANNVASVFSNYAGRSGMLGASGAGAAQGALGGTEDQGVRGGL